MERYVLWFARLGRFYQIILGAAVLTGLVGVAVGAGTRNAAFVTIGVLWILGGSGVVWLADRRERR
jgi:hypothetical protein